ncbi:DUF962 domain-containing protein [Adhaeribacter sp. BT258]|uniref:DUF962 domain-containing protein n=1 Tax=Adhaeribacter terrigena TaxID=2793070 RepID=A0ABS1C2W8_9BACT|nr:Mpo1-like protein [Adhaeribacter terrigena]MBK0403729.1 DUF962 domain-containing protein [Adhaeribacter terrigena]
MPQEKSHHPFRIYLERYAESHQNPMNVLVHWICVPLIAFSLLGLVWAIPVPHFNFLGKMNGYINLATFLILFATVYYLRLSFRIGLAMILTIWVFSAGIISLERMARLHSWHEMWQVCLVIFALAWVGQFIGHKIEGKKPSFLEDLRFLLIGPAWLWAKVFNKLGWRY